MGRNDSQRSEAKTRSSSPHTPDGATTPLTEYSEHVRRAHPFLTIFEANISSQELSRDVAVVGLACRVAGNNDSPEKLWQTIIEKRDTSSEIPAMRWEPYLRRDTRNAEVLDSATSRGYFLENLEDFDAPFFGISPKEAEQMDPQQRLSLEVAWEALERAGIPPQSLSGSDTSVFWGVNSDDYSKLVLEDLPNVEPWMGIGTAYCGVPNRISYQLNLMGPSTAVDAACASSLVAIHHGRQSIVFQESKVAIVGGVNALCGPGLTTVLDKAGAVSAEGRCRSFDDEAQGYGRGEGAAAIVLKNLKDAIQDRDNILAVIKGSAVAQDGRTNGIMAPNGKAQERVANTALDVAGVDPSTIRYVEAHATSTPLGDPTEVSAIANVYGKDRPVNDHCYIGSLKPNIGHLEAGAGAMGFIKTVLTLQQGILPPQANLNRLNSKVDWDKTGVKVLRDALEWPATDPVRRAAICSYGYGGTVSHAVIEEHVRKTAFEDDHKTSHWKENLTVLLLSAPQERRISMQAKTLQSWLGSEGAKFSLDSVATTLATRRGHHDYRTALVLDSHQEAITMLGDVISGSNNAWIAQSRVSSSGANTSTVWVFSGHGAQWRSMGQQLLHNNTFQNAIAPLKEIVAAEMGFSLFECLQSGDFETSDRVQVLTYAMQIGISAVLKSCGVLPDAIIGHSVGEIAASVVAGALTPREGGLIVCRRAVLYRSVAGRGAMALVSKPFFQIQQELQDRKDAVAAIDASPSSCVVSGVKEAVLDLAESWKARGIKAMMVKTDIAFHSPALDELGDLLRKNLTGSLSPKSPLIKLYTTASLNSKEERLRDVDYWVDNMIHPVYLRPAVCAALEDQNRVFVEISSHPIVSHSINETIMDAGIEDYAMIHTMKKETPAEKSLLYSVAQLHCRGVNVDWNKQMSNEWLPELPATPWIHKPIWRNIETGPLNIALTHDVKNHTLLGQRTAVAGTDTVIFTTKLDESTKPFPGNHPLHGTEIIPAAVLVNTFYHATQAAEIRNVILRVPVAINAPRDVQVVVSQDQAKITSRLSQTEQKATDQDLSWVTHTTAQWSSKDDVAQSESLLSRIDIASIRNRLSTRLKNNFTIDYLDKVGVSAMGFPWQITEHWGNSKEMLARVDVSPITSVSDPLPWDSYSWAPLLDSATSVGSTLFFDEPRLRMPAQIEKVSFLSSDPPPKIGWLYVQEATDTALASHVTVANEDGQILAKFTSMRFSEIAGTPGVSGSVESLVHQVVWPPAQLAETPSDLRRILLVSRDAESVFKYKISLPDKLELTVFHTAQDLIEKSAPQALDKHTIILYVPGKVGSLDDVPLASELYTSQLLDIVKYMASLSSPAKVFVATDRVALGETPTALAQSSLHGLSRIIASEHPETFGALIDTEDENVPLTAMKYVHEADVIRISDGVARTARLRPLSRDKALSSSSAPRNLLPKPEGTYVITGGLGVLGIEIAGFLVEKGARRLVLVSRRSFPSRKQWDQVTGPLSQTIANIHSLEEQGATVHVLSVDIAADNAASSLSSALDPLSLPPVLGVIHAAGVLEDQLVLETTPDSFSRVVAPKVRGALALHSIFPPGVLDFFILFSSCGQLFGFPGQSSYASGNAFLDTLATHRRAQGDNAIAFQWTSWRGMGMAASTDFITAELESKGITDVTPHDAFRAWSHVARFDTDHAVVLRSLTFDEGELLPSPILADIAPRRAVVNSALLASGNLPSGVAAAASDVMPPSGPERRSFLDLRIREAVAKVLQGGADEVDSRAALTDLGIDSVMTVALRRQLQMALKVKVPPTLTWSHPTVAHLVGWFEEKVAGGDEGEGNGPT